jgi:DNA recombination protein RmuC
MRESIMHQSGQSQRIIADITEKLTRLDETNRQVVGFADQLRNLQDILKNPKQRGTILGEYYLETILSKVLPPKTFQTQYQFKNGEAVDAVVFVGTKIIPIDSKFSLENYNRIIDAHQTNSDPEPFVAEFKKDIKKRIDETSKYIRPAENTLDFAFMFIPHESIYYDLLVAEVGSIKVNTQDLVQYAFEKKVIIVSPTSFLAYLQTVLQGLRALQIEESAKDIVKRVEELGKHLKAYEEYHNKLGNSLQTVNNHFNASGKELRKVDKDVLRISGVSAGIEPTLLSGDTTD